MARQTPRPGKAKNNGRTHKPHDPLLRRRGQLVGTMQPQRPKYIRNQGWKRKPRRNKDRLRTKEKSPKSTAVNAGFKGSRQNQTKPPLQDNRDDPSSLNRILDRIC